MANRSFTDSSFVVQVEQVTDEQLPNIVPENGAIIQKDGNLYIGYNKRWNQIALGFSSNDLGWARYDDTQYTELSSYAFTGDTEFTIPNNAGSVITKGTYTEFYDKTSAKVKSQNVDDVYILTVAFKAKITNANGSLELYLEGGNGTPYRRVSDMVVFPKGNNVEHIYTKQFQFYADSDVVSNGLSIKALPSDDGEIYEVIYFIQRTQRYE